MKKLKCLFIPLYMFCIVDNGFAQKGKDGAITITANTVVNEYSSLTNDATAGNTSITVNNSALNSNNRFANPLSQGDLIMIIQVQGATINGTASDSTWGQITNYNNCGLYEFSEVSGTPDANTINLSCSLKNNYTASGKTEVVRVPRYSGLTVNSGDTITCDSWNGTIGGILAIEVSGNVFINSGGAINASGKGFRGGALQNAGSSPDILTFVTNSASNGGQKGESIAGYQADYNTYGGMYGRGAPANGGGGGNGANAAGGGGANAGNINGWTGNGNPDTSNTSWIAAWNLEYNGFASSSSSGGGRGGYGTAWGAGNNPLTVPPFSPNWNSPFGPGNDRPNVGGKGGRPLDYSSGRLFLGGGGGAGQENDNSGTAGANGGGIIYLVSYDSMSGSGSIISNGNDCLIGAANDGSGGGGAGGIVILNSTNAISGISVFANGGKGDNQTNSSTESEGPGGGGGGGYIAVSNGSINTQAISGANGTTNSTNMTAFPADGATKGGNGLPNEVINGLPFSSLNAGIGPDVSICSGSSTNLSATGGNTYSWSPANGLSRTDTSNPVASPTLTTVYTVTISNGTCTASDSVKVTVTSGIALNTSPAVDTLVCPGSTIQLIASGASDYLWSPSNNLSCSTCANPLATINDSISYVITGTNSSGCSATKKITIYTINVIPGTVSAIRDTICEGTPGNLSLSGNSGSTIQWQSSTNDISFTPAGDTATTYKTPPLNQSTWYFAVVGSGSCSAESDTLELIVPPALTASFYATQTASNTLTFNADSSKGNIRNYHWDFGDGQTSAEQNPQHTYAKDTTYYVCLTLYDGSNCSYTFCRYQSVADAIPVVTANGSWIIYPNPFSNLLTISAKQNNGAVQRIEIYDVLGRGIINKVFDSPADSMQQLNVSSLSDGIYYLVIRTDRGVYAEKIIK